MAEGGSFSRTLEGGSESLFDHECVQCRTHGSRQEATDFCSICKQFLCNTCGRYHIRNMTTHTLIAVSSMSQSKPIQPTVSSVPVVAKCHIHPDLDIEMYCGTHNMVYCCRCIAKEHRSCSDVKDIDDVAHASNMSTLQALVADITRVSTLLHTTKLERSNDLKLLKKTRASLLDEIKALRKKFNKQLDALELKILAELDKEERQLEKDIGDDITTVDDLIVASDKSKPDLTSQLDEKNSFITEKLGRAILGDANEFLKKSSQLKHLSLKFEPNDALCDAIVKADRMGRIIKCDTAPQRIKRSNYTVKSKHKINVRVKSDKDECCIAQMCQLVDGTILLIDSKNNKLKRLDDQLNVKDFLDFKTCPIGLCSLSPTEVAVLLNDGTVNWVNVGKSLSYRHKFSTHYSHTASSGSMVSCSGQVWILGTDAVYIYSLSGSLVKTIDTDANGRQLFPEYPADGMIVNNDETKVYITLWDRVIVFNNNGDVINKLTDQRLEGVYDVSITEDGIVFVLGCTSKNVVMFDRDGNILGELVSSKYILPAANSLCYDRQKCRLLVAYVSDHVQVFQLA